MDIAINYWAVLGAAVVNMFVGFLWYGPVFGKHWMKLAGITPESMKTMKLTAMQAMFGGFVIALIMSYVLAHVAAVFEATGVAGALALAFWIWLGFVAPIMSHGFLWEGKSLSLFIFNAAAGLVSMVAMTLVIVLWV